MLKRRAELWLASLKRFGPPWGLAVLLALAAASYHDLPIYPDEVTFRLIAGRWFEEGAAVATPHPLCHPQSVPLPLIFWPASMGVSAVYGLIERFSLERCLFAPLLAAMFFMLSRLMARVSGRWLVAAVPAVIVTFGVLPAYWQLLRPEPLWIVLALLLLRGVVAGSPQPGLLAIAAAIFYFGIFIHPQFVLLAPALLALASWMVLCRRLAPLWLLAITAMVVISSSFAQQHLEQSIGCPGYSGFEHYLQAVGGHSLRLPDFDVQIENMVSGPLDLFVIPPLFLSPWLVGILHVLARILLAAVVLAPLLCGLSLMAPWRKGWPSWRQMMPRLVLLLVLLPGPVLMGLDHQDAFYRSISYVAVSWYGLAVLWVLTPYRPPVISFGARLLLLSYGAAGLVSLGLAYGVIAPWYRIGYVGVSTSLATWQAAKHTPASNFRRLRPPLKTALSQLVVDDAAMGIVLHDYPRLYPISFLELMAARQKWTRPQIIAPLASVQILTRCTTIRSRFPGVGAWPVSVLERQRVGMDWICLGEVRPSGSSASAQSQRSPHP